jgi:hypothetical protein
MPSKFCPLIKDWPENPGCVVVGLVFVEVVGVVDAIVVVGGAVVVGGVVVVGGADVVGGVVSDALECSLSDSSNVKDLSVCRKSLNAIS